MLKGQNTIINKTLVGYLIHLQRLRKNECIVIMIPGFSQIIVASSKTLI